MRLVVKWGRLDSNCHGTPGAKRWDRKTLRSTWQIVPLGRDVWHLPSGRTVFGRRLWLYGRTGACVNFDVLVAFQRSPCRRGKYAPRPTAAIPRQP